MTLKIVGLIASLSAAALLLSAGETFAKGGKGGAAVPFVKPGIGAKPFAHHHHRRGFFGGLWPAGGFYYDGAPFGEPMVDAGLPRSTDINYTYKQDVPWDWVHRLPPMVNPSDRAYVSTCQNEPVTVPGNSGEQTVNVMRCY